MNQNIRNKNQAQQKNRGSILPLMLFFPISIFFCELVARLSTFGDLKISQFFLILLTSVTSGFFISFILSLIKNRTALRIVMIAISFIISLVCASQIVYFDIFGSYYNWGDIGMAGEAAKDFSGQLFGGIANQLFPLVLVFLPTILIAVFNKQSFLLSCKKDALYAFAYAFVRDFGVLSCFLFRDLS